jgi:alpha-tubulin suppressor-like RCC1 family protein
MSQIINAFEILNRLEEEKKNRLKTLFIFNNVNEVHPYNNNGKNAIIILEKDEVFAFGNNSLGCLGFGNNTPVWEPTKVRELSDKGIVSLHNGLYHVIAVNDKHEVYVWGSNSLGQLGIGKTQSNFHTPELNHYLIGKSIAQICCGDWHSLALTHFGDVYAWGDNKFGQIGIESERECESKPVKLNSFSGQKIISISCGSMHSMALSENRNVFSWGYNKYGQLGIGSIDNSYRPKMIHLNNSSIIKISCGQKQSFLLSSDGYIYVFGKSYLKGTKKNQKIPIKFNNPNKFIDIVSHISYSLSVAITSDEICYEFGKIDSKNFKPQTKLISIPLKTTFTSIIDYYANEWQITFETIHFSEKSIHSLSYLNQQKLPIVSSIQSSREKRNNSENEDSNDQSLEHLQNIANTNKTERQFSSDGRYENDFVELGLLGKGGFGSVYKVKHKLEEQIYAVKKMQFQGFY